MQVQKLQALIAQYKTFLRQDRLHDHLYKWESLQRFQDHWDVAAADFGEMYELSLQNTQTQRLWKRPAWFPKEMMLEFIQVSPDFVRDLFTELMEEQWDASSRMSQFVYACEDFLKQHNKRPGLWRENLHYHDNHEMLFLYLAFAYPEQYTLFDYDPFRSTLQQVGSHDIPGAYDLTRFIKITRALYKFLQKDEELVELHRKNRDPQIHYMGDSMLIVHDFYKQMGGR